MALLHRSLEQVQQAAAAVAVLLLGRGARRGEFFGSLQAPPLRATLDARRQRPTSASDSEVLVGEPASLADEWFLCVRQFKRHVARRLPDVFERIRLAALKHRKGRSKNLSEWIDARAMWWVLLGIDTNMHNFFVADIAGSMA